MEVILRNFNALGFAAIDGHVMRDILKKDFGATEADLNAYAGLWDRVGQDPTYSFRMSSQTRWHFQEDLNMLQRLEKAPFILTYGDNAVLQDEVREFAEGSDDFIDSTVHVAMMKFVRFFLKEVHGGSGTEKGLGYISGSHQFRVKKDAEVAAPEKSANPDGTKKDCPTPEGVHQDGASVVIVTYINSKNLAPRAGESRVYSKDQAGGPLSRTTSVEARQITRLAERNLVTPFETILLNDREVKHDNKPLELFDPSQSGFRDVHVIWARDYQEEYKDLDEEGKPNYGNPHPTKPRCEVFEA